MFNNDDGPGTTINQHVVDLNGQEPTSSSSQQQQQLEQQGEIQIASSSSPSQHQQNNNNNNSNENSSSSSRNIVDKFTQRIASFARRNANNTPTNQDTNTETTIQVMNSSSHYLTPLPKIDWQVEPTDKLGELYEDILIYMFQFLQPNELIKMGSLNKRMRDVASKDEVWSPVYKSHTFEGVTKDNTITHEFKQAFMTYTYMMRTIVEGRNHALRELPSFKTRQTCFQFSYGLLAPQVFMIAFLIFLILVPLLMDEFIDISMVGYCSLPFFFALGVYFFISISLLLDPYFLQPKRKQYLEAISDNTTVRKDYAFNPKDEDSINLFIWHLWIWLIFILMFISKYIWFAALSAPFTALFVPCYVFFIVYCFAPLCFYFKKRRPFAYRGKIVFGFSYLLNSVIVAGSALQILLIGLKLDGVITTYWNLVFIPAWLFLLNVNCVCFYYTLCATFAPTHEFSYSFCYNILGVLNYLVFVLFYQVWFIIFALRLDNVFIAAFTYLFIPLWIFVIVVLSLHFCCAGGSLFLSSRWYDEEYEEMIVQKLQA